MGWFVSFQGRAVWGSQKWEPLFLVNRVEGEGMSGQVMTYVGAASAAVGGQAAQASPAVSPETINLLAIPAPIPHVEVTLGDIVTLVALGVTVARFRWDVKRDRRRNG